MTLELYGLKTCDTCKTALKALEGAGHAAHLIDIRAETDLKTKVPLWLAVIGADTLINKRSTTWRNLSDIERAAEPVGLLIANPTLIKRPVIEAGGKTYVGWSKDTQAALL